MREIKFRAWNLTENRFLTTEELIYRIEVEAKRQLILDNNLISLNGKPDPSDGIIFQQYTGLKDKNGVEIYEGDIVRSGFSTVVVRWDDDIDQDFYWGNACGFSFNFDPETMDVNGIPVHYEVIGNIFEGVDN